ncbi:MAG TPA: YfdX family protein [Pirellulales bacterium]|jgi:hypothetical protein|nr:YfdX family protein [Pirellulales bacterium]
MKKHILTAVAVAAAILLAAQASTAQAADKAADNNKPAAGAQAKNGLTQDLMKVSDDGYSALREIHLARIAIFNGDTKAADQMLDKAKKDLDEAGKDAQTFAADAKAANAGKKGEEKSASDKMDLIPIDGEIAVADTFVASNEKNKHIEKANEHLKSGRSKEAIEELKLGEVDVVFTRVLLPLEATKKRVADAEKLVNDHKYYEANLALKAAEDGIVIDAVDLMGTPTAPATASANAPTKK